MLEWYSRKHSLTGISIALLSVLLSCFSCFSWLNGFLFYLRALLTLGDVSVVKNPGNAG